MASQWLRNGSHQGNPADTRGASCGHRREPYLGYMYKYGQARSLARDRKLGRLMCQLWKSTFKSIIMYKRLSEKFKLVYGFNLDTNPANLPSWASGWKVIIFNEIECKSCKAGFGGVSTTSNGFLLKFEYKSSKSAFGSVREIIVFCLDLNATQIGLASEASV